MNASVNSPVNSSLSAYLQSLSLPDQEFFFQEFFEQSGDAILILAQQKLIACNQSALKLFGYANQIDFVGLHPAEFSPEKQADGRLSYDKANEMIAAALQQKTHRFEWLHQRQNGEVFDCEILLTCIRIGEQILFSAGIRDISDRKKLERELARQQALFDGFFKAANVGMSILDQDLRYININQQLADSDGITIEEHIGRKFSEVLPGLSDSVEPSLRKVIETGEAILNVESYGETAQQPGVRRYWIDSHFPIPGDNNNVIGVGSIVYEITDRKRTEIALKESEEDLQILFEQSPIGLILCTLEGEILKINPGCANILGKTVEEALQLNYWELSPPQHSQQQQNILQQLQETGRYYLNNTEFINQEAELVPVRLTGLILEKKGQPLIWSSVENTSQEQAELLKRQQAETQLRNTQKFLDSLIENLPIGIFAKDAQELRMAVWNQAIVDILGYSKADALGKNDCDLFPPEQAEIFIANDRQVLAEGLLIEAPAEIAQTPHRGKRILHSRKVPLYDEAGNPQYLMGIVEDVTERKQAEIALKQSEESLRFLANSVPQLVWTATSEGRVDYYNQRWYEYTGMTDEEIQSWGWPALLHPEDLPESLESWNHSVATGRDYQIEYRIKRADHVYRWYLGRALPRRDETGEIVQWVGTCTDIDDQKRIQEELAKSRAIAQKQAQQLEETLLELTQTQAQMVQSEKMSSLGQLVAGVAHEINNPVNFIYGNLIHAHEYTQDLLELVHLYQQHYPQPITDIQVFAEAIDLEFLLSDLPKLLTSMKVGAERIQKIIISLRNFSRMDEAEMKEVNIHDGIDSTLMILQNRLKARPDHSEIKINKQYGELPLVECYAGQLNQVFMNILSNAIDALEEQNENRTLEEINQNQSQIWIQTHWNQVDQIVIRIRDNGPGMSEAVQKQLFNPFFTTKPVGKGTGLGMSISYQIITEKHGGQIKCISNLGQGTEFLIQIPARQPQQFR